MKHGATLIELVLVIAILGILSVAAVVVVFNHKSSYLDAAIKKATSDLQYAQQLAMTNRGTVYGVLFDTTNNRYTVYQTNIATPVADPLTKQPLIETFSNYSGITITGANLTVVFDSHGAPSSGGGGVVTFSDGTRTRTITITAETGKIVVSP